MRRVYLGLVMALALCITSISATPASAGTAPFRARVHVYDGSAASRDHAQRPVATDAVATATSTAEGLAIATRRVETEPSGVRSLAPRFATEEAGRVEFDVADRVARQLGDSRLGSLQGKLTNADLQRLVNEPGAQRLFDTASGNINVIQDVDGTLLRITVASDEFKIISVGPIRANGVANGIANGRFVPIGSGG